MFDTSPHYPIGCNAFAANNHEANSRFLDVNSNLRGEANHIVSPTKRYFWPDLLRIVSAFAVVLLHVAGNWASRLQPGDTHYLSIIFCRVLSSFAVPVFFMLSGMFFVDPNRHVDIPKIVLGCRRLLIAFVFWSAFYALVFPPHKLFIGQFLKGPGHLWFLPALASCYLVVPAIRAIARDHKAEQMLVFAVFFLLCVPTTLRSLSDSFRRVLPSTIAVLSAPVFLFVLGDFCHRFPPTGKVKWGLYLIGCFNFAATFALTVKLWMNGLNIDYLLGVNQSCIVLFSATVFVAFQSLFSAISIQDRWKKLASDLSQSTFGVYLIHMVFVKSIPNLSFFPVVDIVLRTIFCFSLSLVATLLLRRIPIVKAVIA